jgi:amino-acid N-acetyltransferase
MEIRSATPGDVEAVTDLLRAAGLPVSDLSEELVGNFLVASVGSSVAGCIGLEAFSNTGLLRSLVVGPGFRDAGVGRLLVTALEARARRRGIEELWLLTIDAERYFASLGYSSERRSQAPEAIRHTAEFSRLCPGNAILMKKEI